MKGKFHTEEAVIPILLRKGIVVKEHGYDEHNNQVIIKEIGIPQNVNPGLKILGKLDFMRKQGWTVLKLEDMTVDVKPQVKKKRKEEVSEKPEKRKRVFKKIFKKQ